MWELSAAAREHFEHPRNVGALDPNEPDVVEARVGEPVSGDILQLHLRIDDRGVIVAARFKAYGCGWPIACGSLLTECVEGRSLAEAGHFRHRELVERLGIPPAKLHCAVLAETALNAALRAIAAKSASATIPDPIP
jgi:NifU-like protein involved in Fe-S cluster formation